MAKYKIEGMKELEKSIKLLEKLPQTCVTKAAKKGATIALKSARGSAPVDSGNLRKGIVIKGERVNAKGKKVYDVKMDRAMNDIFQKTAVNVKQLRMYHGHSRKTKDPRYEAKTSYYPASQEYGFKTVNGKYIPGYGFLRKSIADNENKIENTIVETLSKEIDKLK